jgi:GTPase SAR1 family protein
MYFRDVNGSRKLCLFKEGRNDMEATEYFKKKEVQNSLALVVGSSGSGKSVFANSMVNELVENGYTAIYITEKEADELANAFHCFEPSMGYHVNMLREQRQEAKVRPVKIYHPWTFGIPYKKKLPNIKWFTYDLKQVSRAGFRSIISSESPMVIDVCMDLASSISEDATIYDFLWKLYLNINNEESQQKLSRDDMFLPSESPGSRTTLKNVKLAFKTFVDNYFLEPYNSDMHLNYVDMCNDSEHIHHLTHKWIKNDKAKLFSIIEFLEGINRAISSGLVKKQIVLVFEEIKILFPSGQLEPYQEQLLDLIYKMFSRIRTHAFVIATSQSYFDLNRKVVGLFPYKFIGRIDKRDIGGLIKLYQIKSFEQYKLYSLKIGEFLLWESNEFNEDEQFSYKIIVDVPPFANHEQGSDFFTKYASEYPDYVSNSVEIYNLMVKRRDEAERNRISQNESYQKLQQSKKEVKDLRQDGKVEEALQKVQAIKKEKRGIIIKQVYDLKSGNPELSWSEVAKRCGLKHHDTAKKMFEEYVSTKEGETNGDIHSNV